MSEPEDKKGLTVTVELEDETDERKTAPLPDTLTSTTAKEILALSDEELSWRSLYAASFLELSTVCQYDPNRKGVVKRRLHALKQLNAVGIPFELRNGEMELEARNPVQATEEQRPLAYLMAVVYRRALWLKLGETTDREIELYEDYTGATEALRVLRQLGFDVEASAECTALTFPSDTE